MHYANLADCLVEGFVAAPGDRAALAVRSEFAPASE